MLAFGGRNTDDLSIGHDASVDPRTGAALLRVPIPAPPGRGGMGPNLSLSYSSSGPNSPFGSGWSVEGLPAIGIDTSQQVPRWNGTDTYQFGGDPLVPWLESNGAGWTTRGFTDADWSVAYYRSRASGAQVRVERWVDRRNGRTHFRTRDARNVLTIYGARPDRLARLADPVNEMRTFVWLPELQIDPAGNAVWVDYTPETLDEVDRAASYEQRRAPLAQRYLKTFRFGNVQPFQLTPAVLSGQLPPAVRWCYQLVFDYGDHADPDMPAAEPDRVWLARPDPFSSGRAGFEIRTYRLCRRILSFHDFDEIGAGPTLVGSLVLEHDQDISGSTLREISWRGHRRDGADFTSSALPPLRMRYALPATGTAFADPPVETQQNVPAGFAGRRHLLIDLAGDGLPGILAETERAWFYKPNEGEGRFGPQVLVQERPAGRAGAYAFGDVNRDGDTELAQLAGRLAGLYQHDRATDRWQAFKPFPALPRVEGFGRGAQWVDLNGDGRPDIVVPFGDRLTWYPSDGDSFADPIEIRVPLATGETPAFREDAALDLFFADMNGDGLIDLARARNGRVEYWPSLGNGRFGDAVILEGSPQLAPEGELDASRIRFVDLDGSGTADLVVIGRGEVSIWTNAAGNSLVPRPRLLGLPYIDNVSAASIVDFLGDGRPCLVWSSPLPGRDTPLQYLPLAPTTAPRLLLSVADSLGQSTHFTYSSSASHYLRDKRAGRPWSTKLPTHVTVVDRHEVADAIGGTRSVQRFEYHDGFYDGAARALRGFGRVDIYDAEAAAEAEDPAFLAPTLLTKTWFHQGVPDWIAAPFVEAYDDDQLLPRLHPHVIDGPTADDLDDAARALSGRVVRSEQFSVDAAGLVDRHPLAVTQVSFRVTRAQPRQGQALPAFDVIAEETLGARYDGIAGDPRVTHNVVVDVDRFGLVMRDAEIAYARRGAQPRDVAVQGVTQLVVHDHAFAVFDERDRFELGVPLEGRDYELVGVGGDRITRQALRQPDVVNALNAPHKHHEDLQPGVSARLIAWERSVYWNDARLAALAHGQVGRVALIHHEETASFAVPFAADVFAGKADDARLQDAGYFKRDDLWWRAAETSVFGGPDLFFQRTALVAGDGGRTEFSYDHYGIELTSWRNASGLLSVATIDYHLPAPRRISDPNELVSEVRYDPLGVVVTTSVGGQVQAARWGFEGLDAVVKKTPATLADLLADPGQFIQGAGRYVWYDLDAWQRDATPPVVATLVREELRHDGRGGGDPNGRVAITLAYFDGLGRTLQSKLLVDAGDAIQRDVANDVVVDGGGRPVLAHANQRWQVSGHVVYDRKQQPRREYEPYFSPASGYEGDPVLRQFGVAMTTLYDAEGRVAGQVLPNGTFTANTYQPWSVEQADANDTVLGSAYRASREALAGDDPEKQALEHAKAHGGTTIHSFLDPSGREAGTLARGGATAADHRSETRFDGAGHVIGLIDPRGLTAFTYRRDMEGRILLAHSVDAGDTWTLPDAQDRVIQTWDAAGTTIRQTFDTMGRPVSKHVMAGGIDAVVEEYTYGDAAADGVARNARGQLTLLRDQGGEMAVAQYDPAGQVFASTRTLRTDLDDQPDWRGTVPLEAESFTTAIEYDALGRARRLTQPDGSVRTIAYGRDGALSRHAVSTPDGILVNHAIVDDATYDARGRRSRTVLGNGVEVTFGYDTRTSALSRQVAVRAGRTYQDITYTRDPVGNIVRIEDAAHDGAGALIAGGAVSARRDYAYDAHYRLRRATGRVHQALLQRDYSPVGGSFKGTRHVTLNNGVALEKFVRTYGYDASGNLLQIKHVGPHSWTTDLWVSATSNRSIPTVDANGIAIANPAARFDALGNITQFDHLRRIDWSWRGHLSRAVVIERAAGTDDGERYAYGADAMRLRKLATRLDGAVVETTEKVYLGSCERKQVRRDGVLVLERWTSSFEEGEQRVALLHRWTIDDLARETSDPSQPRIHYQLTTHQGSSAIEIDQSGDVISYEEYFPYGATSFVAGNAARDISVKEYRYSGKECDDATGLYYYGYRYFAAWMGRWISPDPVGPHDDLNLYQFVLGDPVGNVDPDGLQTAGAGDDVVVGHVQTGLTERQARAQFNASRGLELGYQVTRLQALGNDHWRIVSRRYIPPRALEFAREHNSLALGEALASLEEAAATIANTPPIEWPPELGGGDAQGNPGNGQNGSGGAQSQPPSDPSSGGGQSEGASDAEGTGPASGTATEGDGPGSGLQGQGPGGGVQAPNGVGQGTSGDGTASGNGIGEGVGQGGTNPTGGSGKAAEPGGRQEQHQKVTGTGTGQTTGQINPGQQGTGTAQGQGAGGGGGTGVSTGNPHGSPEGIERGSPDGVSDGAGGGASPPLSGTGAPSIETAGSDSGTGTPNGGTSERGPDNPANRTPPDTGTGPGGGRPGGRPEGSRTGTHSAGAGTGSPQGEKGGGANGTLGFRENTLDTLTRWAGYANFEFGASGEGGQRGGVPGGHGSRNSGWIGQVAYVGLTILSWIGPGAALKGLRLGIRGLTRAASSLARGVTGAFRAGAATLGRAITRLLSAGGRHAIDPLVDTNILVNAHRAWRGSGNPIHQAALSLLKDKSYSWVITPTVWKEFARVPLSGASRRRFVSYLEKEGTTRVMSGAEAAAHAASPAFRDTLVALQKAVNRSTPGMGTRLGNATGKSFFNDIVQTAFARSTGIPYASDFKFWKFIKQQAPSYLADLIRI